MHVTIWKLIWLVPASLALLTGCSLTHADQSERTAAQEPSIARAARPVVYIASPYTKGDPAINTHFQCEIWNRLMDDGVVWPVAPLWSHFQHTMYPRKYEDWVAYDLALIPRYDACLRLKSEYSRTGYSEEKSTGADNEVAEFKRLGKPVFYSIEELYAWAKNR